MLQTLEVAGNNYPVIVEKLREGLAFYRRLSGNVTKLRDRAREVLRQHRASDRDKANEPAVERADPSAGSLPPAGACVQVYACFYIRIYGVYVAALLVTVPTFPLAALVHIFCFFSCRSAPTKATKES